MSRGREGWPKERQGSIRRMKQVWKLCTTEEKTKDASRLTPEDTTTEQVKLGIVELEKGAEVAATGMTDWEELGGSSGSGGSGGETTMKKSRGEATGGGSGSGGGLGNGGTNT